MISELLLIVKLLCIARLSIIAGMLILYTCIQIYILRGR
jgi:hypothetical protein